MPEPRQGDMFQVHGTGGGVDTYIYLACPSCGHLWPVSLGFQFYDDEICGMCPDEQAGP